MQVDFEMSSSLTVLTKKTEAPEIFKVYWACGKNTQGIVTVTVTCTTQSNEVVAELCALQHLLEIRDVCGKDRAGNALTIICSAGAIRKLAQGKSDKESLAPFALFLRTRFADASISASKDEAFISLPKANNHVDELIIDRPMLSAVEFPDGLKVGVTHHALSAYMVRYQVTLAANAWRALRAAVSHPQTRLQQVTAEENNEHGKTVRAYVTAEGLRLIVAEDPVGPRLLTCYYAHKYDQLKRWATK